MIPYTKETLPVPYDIANARRRQITMPRWMTNPDIMTRTMKVYDSYMGHTRLHKISEEFGISVSQIYVDINNARQFSLHPSPG